MDCICDPLTQNGFTYNTFIARYFADCIYSPSEYTSFGFAYIGLLASCLSLLPQFLLNYRLKSVEGLSFYLLLGWTLGDLGSLVGSFLTQQLQPQIVTAFTFFIMDCCMCLQYGYYQHARPFLLGYENVPSEHFEGDQDVLQDTEVAQSISVPVSVTTASAALLGAAAGVAIMPSANALPSTSFLTTTPSALVLICNAKAIVSIEAQYVGVLISWASGLFYFTSRIPVVWKNYQTKCVDGLSFHLFFLTIIGNLGYGLSVCLRMPVGRHIWVDTFPFLLGSIGVLGFDFFILAQFYWYRTVTVNDVPNT